jgi:hypothetical protein
MRLLDKSSHHLTVSSKLLKMYRRPSFPDLRQNVSLGILKHQRKFGFNQPTKGRK